MDQTTRPERPAGPLTLAIDVGGTRLKAGILATTGHMTAGPRRIDTPHPATPEAVEATAFRVEADRFAGVGVRRRAEAS